MCTFWFCENVSVDGMAFIHATKLIHGMFQMIFFAPWTLTRTNTGDGNRMAWHGTETRTHKIDKAAVHTIAPLLTFFTHYNSFVVWLWKMSELWIVGVWHAWITLHPFSLQQTIGEPITLCGCMLYEYVVRSPRPHHMWTTVFVYCVPPVSPPCVRAYWNSNDWDIFNACRQFSVVATQFLLCLRKTQNICN